MHCRPVGTSGEAPGEWTRFDIGYIAQGTDAFEEDYEGRGTVINFPGITYGLYVSAAEVTPEVTLEAWAEMLAETMHSDSSCQGAPEREALTAGGEPALMLVYDRTDCSHDHHAFVVGVLHEGRGFDIFWLARQGESMHVEPTSRRCSGASNSRIHRSSALGVDLLIEWAAVRARTDAWSHGHDG